MSPASGLEEIGVLLLLREKHQLEDHEEQYQEKEAGIPIEKVSVFLHVV